MHIHKTIEEKTNECLALLRSTKRDKIENLIAHITEMGFFVAPGSLQHHRFEGGLVSHSLETYHTAMALREQKILQGTNPSELPEASVILCSLLHDLCKADTLRYDHETHNAYTAKHSKGHSQRSVRQVGYSGFELTDAEKDAILWHMGGRRFAEDRKEHFAHHPLSEIIYDADKQSIHIAKKRHHKVKPQTHKTP